MRIKSGKPLGKCALDNGPPALFQGLFKQRRQDRIHRTPLHVVEKNLRHESAIRCIQPS